MCRPPHRCPAHLQNCSNHRASCQCASASGAPHAHATRAWPALLCRRRIHRASHSNVWRPIPTRPVDHSSHPKGCRANACWRAEWPTHLPLEHLHAKCEQVEFARPLASTRWLQGCSYRALHRPHRASALPKPRSKTVCHRGKKAVPI